MTFQEWVEETFGPNHLLTYPELDIAEAAWQAAYAKGVSDGYAAGRRDTDTKSGGER